MKAIVLGLPKPIDSNEKRQKISKLHKGRKKTIEQKRQMSICMKAAVKNHPESYSSKNVCGRNKQIEYKGIKLNSSWEKIVVEWLDQYNIQWKRNDIGFKYYWNEKKSYHLYFPDFYLPDLDLYIEVKGYERERDRCKWKALDNLIILKEVDINNIKTGQVSPHSYTMLKG